MTKPVVDQGTRVQAIRDLEETVATTHGHERINALTDLAAKLTASDAPAARDHAAEALEMARQLADPALEAKALQALAYAQWGCSDLDAAEREADKALVLFQELGDKTSTARTYLVKSMVYTNQSRAADATEAILTAHRLSEEDDDPQGTAIALNGLSVLYLEQGHLDKALDSRIECAEIHRRIGDRYRYAIALNNIGEVHRRRDDLDVARDYFHQALEELTEIEPAGFPIGFTYHNLGDTYDARDEPELALSFFEKAREIHRTAGEPTGFVVSSTRLGEFHLRRGDAKTAEPFLKEAISRAAEVGLPSDERNATELLARLYEERCDWQAALRCRKRISDLQDVLFDERQSRHAAELQAKYDVERRKRESEIHELKYVTLERETARREKAEEALIQSQKLESLGLMAGGIAHDFNNMLLSILGNTDLASGLLEGHLEAQEHLRYVHESAQHAADLSRMMLSYAGRGRYELRSCDLGAAIRASEELLWRIALPDVALVFSLDEAGPLIEADETQLHQILVNLIHNAVEAGATSINIAARYRTVAPGDEHLWRYTGDPLSPGAHVSLIIEDNGGGIEAEALPKVFDPFYSTRFTGRGLGLAAVLGIVRGHRAGVTVESQVGRGSRFEFVFPVNATTAGAHVPDPAATVQRAAVSEQRGTVLVIEDEQPIRNLVVRILESGGMRAITASEGRAGVELFRERPETVDVVLLDVTMPGMSAAQIWNELREIDPEVKVVITSGFDPSRALTALPKDVAFLQKPYDPSALMQVIGDQLKPAG